MICSNDESLHKPIVGNAVWLWVPAGEPFLPVRDTNWGRVRRAAKGLLRFLMWGDW